jgi:signal transduction histidine kinase
MRDASGTITGSVAIVRDITEFKQAEEAAHARAIQIELHHRLLEQREQERQKIARDLHDGPVQELMGMHYALEEMLHRVNDAAVRDSLLDVRDTLQSQVAELRAFASELRPPTLAKFGLGKAIRSHLDTFQEKHSELRVSFEQNQVGELIPEEMRLALYRIYQESLTNIVKHAQATQITVRLVKSLTEVLLDIQDNGRGFAVPEDWVELARAGHLGLVGIQERAEAIGGQVGIQSRVGEGTSIQVTVSL